MDKTLPVPVEPRGDLTVRVAAMPADTNANGDIFGGWVLSQMDVAGGIAAAEHAKGRVVTIAIDAMTFIRPVKVGDVLCVYTAIEQLGRTSMKIHIEAWARRAADARPRKGDRRHLHLRRNRRGWQASTRHRRADRRRDLTPLRPGLRLSGPASHQSAVQLDGIGPTAFLAMWAARLLDRFGFSWTIVVLPRTARK